MANYGVASATSNRSNRSIGRSWKNARNAALSDPRFLRFTREAFIHQKLEGTVLTRPMPLSIKNPEELLQKLCPRADGVILELVPINRPFCRKSGSTSRQSAISSNTCRSKRMRKTVGKPRESNISCRTLQRITLFSVHCVDRAVRRRAELLFFRDKFLSFFP